MLDQRQAFVNDETEKQKERHPADDLKWVDELNKLDPARGKGISRVNGVIMIAAGLGFIYVAIASDWNVIFRIFPLLGGITFVAIGIGALRGVG